MKVKLLGLAWLLTGAWLAAAAASDPPSPQTKPATLSFDTLKKWAYVEGKTPIPDFIKKLDGQYIEMTGYMMPLTDITDIKEFVFAQYLFGCCYGQPPAANHVILVTIPEGHTTKFIRDVIQVIGTFHVGEIREDGYLVSLYRLECEEIKRPTPRLPHVGFPDGPM